MKADQGFCVRVILNIGLDRLQKNRLGALGRLLVAAPHVQSGSSVASRRALNKII